MSIIFVCNSTGWCSDIFHISSIVLVPWSSCLGGYLSVPDDYPLVLGCEEHVSSLGIFVA